MAGWPITPPEGIKLERAGFVEECVSGAAMGHGRRLYRFQWTISVSVGNTGFRPLEKVQCRAPLQHRMVRLQHACVCACACTCTCTCTCACSARAAKKNQELFKTAKAAAWRSKIGSWSQSRGLLLSLPSPLRQGKHEATPSLSELSCCGEARCDQGQGDDGDEDGGEAVGKARGETGARPRPRPRRGRWRWRKRF